MHHRLLQRQLRRAMGTGFVPDAGWSAFLELVSNYYAEVDRDRNLIENALAVNSEELESLYARLRERADAEQALLRSFTNSIPDLFFAKSPDGSYLGCNREFESFVGRPEREIVGRRVHDLLQHRATAEPLVDDLTRHLAFAEARDLHLLRDALVGRFDLVAQLVERQLDRHLDAGVRQVLDVALHGSP